MKVLLMAALLSMLVVPLIVQAATDQASTEATIKQSVSFRAKPSTTGSFIRYLKKGEPVTVLDKINAYWYSVKDNMGKTGYVTTSDTYISVISNSRIVAGVNFRPKPTTASTRIRMLKADEKMLVLEQINDSWYRARDLDGVEGYVSTSSNYIVTDFSVTGIIIPIQDQIDRVIQAGLSYLNTPYEFGSSRSNTVTFDCSDFVRQAFLDGVNELLPGDSRGQGELVKSLDTQVFRISELKRGDLMFFMSYMGYNSPQYSQLEKLDQTITHVGIYLGDGKILQTYSVTSGGVRVDDIAGTSWEDRFLFGGSVLK